ncbi:MAG: cache domain-containing protein [Sulfurospirillum sp.]
MDKQEKQVLRLIKSIPILLVFVFFVVVGNKIQVGKQNIEYMKKNFLQIKKNRIKNEVLALVRHINYQRRIAKKTLKEGLKQKVDMAYAISMNIYMQNKDKDKKVITTMIKDALRPIRFNQNRGYIFIYTMKLKNILLPIEPQLEGSDFSNYKDIKGDLVVKNMAKLCKKYGGTFYTWYWKKPSESFEGYKKIGYGRYFEPLDWFIGTGEYTADFEKNLQDEVLKEIQDMRYERDKYFFTISYAGTILTHINRSYVGKNQINIKDKDRKYFINQIIKTAKNGSGFINYKVKIDTGARKTAKKISYVEGLDEWRWAIGLGEYLDDIDMSIHKREKELRAQLHGTLIRLAIVFVLIAILLSILLFVLTQKSKEIFLKYKNTILDEMEKSKKQLMLIQNQNKLASMGEMLGNISHQWKQPLNTLGISVSKMMLLEEDGYLSKEIMLKSLSRMEKNIAYLSKTIDVFRDFFKPSVNVEKFNLEEEIEDIVYMVQCSFEHSLISISCVCDDDILIKGDRKKLEQVFLNILNNAKDAILSNKIRDGAVEIKAVKTGQKVKITIQDNALGVPLEIKDKIFEPYFTTKDQSKGTGVGLYMSKIIIENNFQGELDFENRKAGAEFVIFIPLD